MGSNPGLSSGGVGPDAQLITLLTTGIFAANTLPAILLGSLAGVWADRWPKRAVMVASNGLRTLITLAVPFMLLPGPSWLGLSWGYWGLLVITFLESCLTQFLRQPSWPPSRFWWTNPCCYLPIRCTPPPPWRPRSWASPWVNR